MIDQLNSNLTCFLFRNKARLKNEQSHEDEKESPSPLSTRNLRNKYVRKPLHQYGEADSSPPTDKQVC